MRENHKVHHVMTRDVVTIADESSVYDAAKIMDSKKIGSAVVLKDDKVMGLVTEQDILRKVVAKGIDPQTAVIRDIIEKDLISVESNRELEDAISLMGNSEIKHLPVIDNGELVGIITAKDVIRIEPYFIEMLNFKSSLSKNEAKQLFKSL